MNERHLISDKMRAHYETVWQAGDAWDFETSEFEQARYAHQLGFLAGQRYERALEIGCGSGCFTRRLAGIADRVVALDIAEAAIERARVQAADAGPGTVEFRVADAMHYDLQAEGPWNLVILSETMYCLGWLYPFFDIAWFACQLFNATSAGGRLLLTNTYGQKEKDWLLQPWIIDTYRDLFRNVGYRLEREEIFRGTKAGVDFSVLLTLFHKVDAPGVGT
jgi:SAM-dependent methyltransferase